MYCEFTTAKSIEQRIYLLKIQFMFSQPFDKTQVDGSGRKVTGSYRKYPDLEAGIRPPYPASGYT